MLLRKSVVGIIVYVFLAVVLVGQIQSQQRTQRGNRGQGRNNAGRRMRWNPEEMQKRMLERMKENLAAGDDEWKVIEPRLKNVMTLSMQARGWGGRMRFEGRNPRGRGRNRGGDRRPNEGDTARKQTDIEKSTESLRTILENKEAKPEQIKEKLTALRTAREKAKQELAKAQQKLREVLTMRQEAQLVLMGQLE